MIRTAVTKIPFRLIAILSLLLICLCSYQSPQPCLKSPSYKRPVQPDTERPLKLVELLDIALSNSPLTEQSWANAKAVAATIGQAESNYWPTIDAIFQALRSGDTGFSGINRFFQTEFLYNITLTWILLDFGTIDYQVETAVANFKAAQWTYNWTIQTVFLSVFEAYFNYLTTEALYAAALTNLQEALISEQSAVVAHESGVSAITDVLQAKAFRVSVQLEVQNQYSAMLIAHANLANVMGLPPNTCFKVEELPSHFIVEKVDEQVELLMKQARCARADLAAQRATVQAFKAAFYAQEAAFWPFFSATGNFQKGYVNHQTNDTAFNAALNLTIPLFSGFSQIEIIRQAKAELMSQNAQLRQMELQAFLDVFTAYYTVKNASVNLVYTKEFLKFAEAAYEAILVGYQHGTQSFTDLQSALVTLQNARASRIQSQTGWFVSLAQLGYSLGCLSIPPCK